jgi:Tol biopolymer transport system component
VRAYAVLAVLAVLAGVLAATAPARGGLYTPPPADRDPVWSPDETQLAYYRQGSGIRLVNADGSGDHALPGIPAMPDFAISPDWLRIAVIVFQGSPNAFDLELFDLDGGGRRVLATATADAAPAFSPDGARIAYVAEDGVHVVDVDGGAAIRVAERPGFDLAWSPDGTQIAYAAVYPAYGRVEVVRADGGGAVATAEARSSGPAWSPDGRTLAYFQGKQVRVGIAGAAYTTPGPPGGRPSWTPDGRSIYYQARERLYRLDLAQGREHPVGPASADVALAPAGTAYAYSDAGACGDRVGIYVGRRRITDDCRVYGTPGPDRLVSSGALYEIVDGLGGDDRLVARGAAYVGGELDGGPGKDVLVGGFWPDRLVGGPGADTLYGGVNHDVLVGGPGRDRLYGQGGTDTIFARDGMRDLVDCGTNTGRTNKTPELDTAYVDRYDLVRGCERIFRSR